MKNREQLHMPYCEYGIIKDKPPSVTEEQIQSACEKLRRLEYPTKDFLAIIDSANKYGYSTFDLKTKKPISYNHGYWVSFQVNKSVGKRRDYPNNEYDDYVYECMTRTKSLPYIGCYGNTEASFLSLDFLEACNIAIDFNQKSIYDNKYQIERFNEFYNYKTNPTAG